MSDLAIRPEAVSLAALPAAAAALTIDSAESYQYAADLDKACGDRVAAVKRELDPSREAAHALWKGLVAKIADFCRPAEDARAVIRKKMGAWDREQERRRREAEEAARAERERQEREAQEKLAAALAAEAAGDVEAAVEALETAAAVEAAPPPPVELVPTPTARGVAMRSYWSAEVVDLRALVRFALGGPDEQLAALIVPNMETLNRHARLRKSEDLGIPGVRGVERREPARTGRQ